MKAKIAEASRRGETQSADSFMRVLWPFGGALIDPETFEPALQTEASLEGLNFRQALMEYMPEGIVDYDHSEAVNALAQGRVAMITEWSAFYSTVVSPETPKVADCVEIAPAYDHAELTSNSAATSRARSMAFCLALLHCSLPSLCSGAFSALTPL